MKKKLSDNNGRVDEDTLTELSQFAKSKWEQEFRNAERAFSAPEPDDLRAKGQWMSNKKAALALLKDLAQHRSGAVHPKGRNTMEEKNAAQRWLDIADAELQKGAVVNVQSDDDE